MDVDTFQENSLQDEDVSSTESATKNDVYKPVNSEQGLQTQYTKLNSSLRHKANQPQLGSLETNMNKTEPVYRSVESQLNEMSQGGSSRCRQMLRCENIGLCVAVLLVWVLLSVPIALYHVPLTQRFENSDDVMDELISNTTYQTYSRVCNITCREDFFCREETTKCVPDCGSFKQWPPSITVFLNVINIASSSIGLTSALVVLVVAYMRRKKVLAFPNIFVVYQCTTGIVLLPLLLIAFVDQEGLFCSSRDLNESLQTSTPFCVIMGIVLLYIPIQWSLWLLFHTVVSFWKLQFPFHYRSFQLAERTKYVHIGCVVFGLLFPLVPVIATIAHGIASTSDTSVGGLGDGLDNETVLSTENELIGRLGFRIISFPPKRCSGVDGNVAFYSFVLPIFIIVLIEAPFLVGMFWLIHKQQGIFRRRLKPSSKKLQQTDRKLLFIFIYYVTTIFIALVSFATGASTRELFPQELAEYFRCESEGHDPHDPCDRSGFEQLMIPTETVMTLGISLQALFPFVNLIYVVNTKDLKLTLKSLLTPCTKS